MTEDSDEEFEGFEVDTNQNDADTVVTEAGKDYEFAEDKWIPGDRPKPRTDFTGTPGLQSDLPDNPTMMDFMDLFFTTDMYEVIVVETNRYARQYLEKENLKPNSRFNKLINGLQLVSH